MAGKKKNRKGTALMKMIFLLVFIEVVVFFVRFSPVRQCLTADRLGLLLESAGLWAPLILVIISVAGVSAFFFPVRC